MIHDIGPFQLGGVYKEIPVYQSGDSICCGGDVYKPHGTPIITETTSGMVMSQELHWEGEHTSPKVIAVFFGGRNKPLIYCS